MAVFVPANSALPLREVAPANGTDFQLDELYALLACDSVETLPLADGFCMVLDEEGKRTGKRRNERATRLASFVSPKQLIAEMLRASFAGRGFTWLGERLTDMTTEVDYIVGDILICASDELP